MAQNQNTENVSNEIKITVRQPDVLELSKQFMNKLSPETFDAVYADIPWKNVTKDYLKSLPIKEITKTNSNSVLFIWADNGNLVNTIEVASEWGFSLHSCIHTLVLDNTRQVVIPNSKTKEVKIQTDTTSPEDSNADANSTTPELTVPESTSTSTNTNTNKKTSVSTSTTTKRVYPPNWLSHPEKDYVTYPKTKSLYLFVKDLSKNIKDILKDFSTTRKKIDSVTTVLYPPEGNNQSNGRKKIQPQDMIIYPEYQVWKPYGFVDEFMASILKQNLKSLVLFGKGLSSNMYYWGPNVPGYLSPGLRSDDSILVNTLSKFFTSQKPIRIQRHVATFNAYIAQLLKGTLKPTGVSSTTVSSKVSTFHQQILQKLRQQDVSSTTFKFFDSHDAIKTIEDFSLIDPVIQIQYLLLYLNIIRNISKNRNNNGNTTSKILNKKKTSVENNGQPRPKYGIAAPVDVSVQLKEFLGLESEEKVARTQVVKSINDYIRKNGLQNPQKKNEIDLDHKLQTLLNPGEDFGKVTFFNLCKLLGKHFNPSNKNLVVV